MGWALFISFSSVRDLFSFFSFSLFLFDWLMSWGPRSSGPRGCLFFFLLEGFFFLFPSFDVRETQRMWFFYLNMDSR